MGACLSLNNITSCSTYRKNSCAFVVSANGQCRQYPVHITVSEVLQSESSFPDSFFLCNSDRLYFNENIPALEPTEELKPAQIYFVLSTTKLKYRLAGSDMAALAVKASVALEQINRRNPNKKTRISPVMAVEEDLEGNYQVNQKKINSSCYYNSSNKAATTGIRVSRSPSLRKLSRTSSKRAKLAVRSFRIKLSTIYE